MVEDLHDLFHLKFNFDKLDGYTEIQEQDFEMGTFTMEELDTIKKQDGVPLTPLALGGMTIGGIFLIIKQSIGFSAYIFTVIAGLMAVFAFYDYYKRRTAIKPFKHIALKRGVVLDKRRISHHVNLMDATGLNQQERGRMNYVAPKNKQQMYDFITVVFPEDKTYIRSIYKPQSVTSMSVSIGDPVVVYRIQSYQYANAIPTRNFVIPEDFCDFIEARYGIHIGRIRVK